MAQAGFNLSYDGPVAEAGARTCRPEDMEAVARIFLETYRTPAITPPAELVSYFQDLYFGHPWFDPELPSLVYQGEDGEVLGFLGSLPVRMTYRGRPLRAAIVNAISGHDPKRNPLVPAKLLRRYLAGPQELTFSETSNAIAVRLWKPQGGQTVPGYGAEWMRLMRPASLITHFLGKGGLLRRAGAAGLSPITWATDSAARAILRDYIRVPTAPTSFAYDRDVTAQEYLAYLIKARERYALAPQSDLAVLNWQFEHAAQKSIYGDRQVRMVYDKRDRPMGAYIYYGRKGGAAFALPILAEPGQEEAVLDSLFAHAYEAGNVVIRGKVEPRISEALLDRHCIFHRRTATQVLTRNQELLTTIRAGDACLMGFAGQTWHRFVGHY